MTSSLAGGVSSTVFMRLALKCYCSTAIVALLAHYPCCRQMQATRLKLFNYFNGRFRVMSFRSGGARNSFLNRVCGDDTLDGLKQVLQVTLEVPCWSARK